MSREGGDGTAAKKFGRRSNGPDQQAGTFSHPVALPVPSPSEQPGTLAAASSPPNAMTGIVDRTMRRFAMVLKVAQPGPGRSVRTAEGKGDGDAPSSEHLLAIVK